MTKKDILTQTLREELETKKFSAISVIDICKKSHTSRQVFYYYFTSLTDCLLELLLKSYGVELLNNTKDFKASAIETFRYIYNNRVFFNNIFGTGNQSYYVSTFIVSQFKTNILRINEEINPHANELSREDKDYIASFFASLCLVTCTRWISKGLTTTPEEEVEKLFAVSDWNLPEISKRILKLKKESE